MTTTYDLVDAFGRLTRFAGDLLVSDSTNHSDDKPTWSESTIYRTAGGSYIVDAWSRSRYFHISKNCSRLRDRETEPATKQHTWVCSKCVPENHDLREGFGESDRHTVTVCDGPQELIAALSAIDQRTGLRTHGSFSQALLRRVSMQDPAVEAAWMFREVK